MQTTVLCILYLVFYAESAPDSLKATIANGGVKGTVTFTQEGVGTPVTVNYNLAGPSGPSVTSFELRKYRVLYDVSDRCSLARLGEKKYPPDGVFWTSKDNQLSGLNLTGLQSAEGMSIALFATDKTVPAACGNVEPETEYVTARATLRQGIVGLVTFRQAAGGLTRVTYDLTMASPLTSPNSVGWRVVRMSDCTTVASPYNSASGDTSGCSPTDQSSCAIGDLSGKLGPLTFDTTSRSARGSAVDMKLPLSGVDSVVGRALQLVDSSGTSQIVACALITDYTSRNAVALFDDKGVTGMVTFTQRSPFDPTQVKVELSGLRQQASGWHVHAWPVPQRLEGSQSLCGADSTSGHFNPFGIVVKDSPPPGTSTEDLYEIGDLSGKFGTLENQASLSATYTDTNLPLSGRYSVLGRSLVIHHPNTTRWICANIRDTAALTYALATFTFPVIGYVLLQQRVGEPEGDTSVFLQLNYADGSTAGTSGHALSVHQNAVREDFLSDSARCTSAGGLYAPFAVGDTGGCAPSAPLLCEVGDLLGKHETVVVREGKAFFTDVNLALQGSRSVEGRSLVLTAANNGDTVLSCANILRVSPLTVEASSWDNTTTTLGKVTFTQPVGVIKAPTAVRWELQSLFPTSPVSQKIYEKPAGVGAACGGLGSVYNPFSITDGSTVTTKDTSPVGDLSAKFGDLTGPSVTKDDLDTNLDLWGPRSVLGHALSLTVGGIVAACANLVARSSQGGQLVQAKAVFTGDVTGEILLSQYVFENGSEMPTTVVVNLRRASGTQTLQHNWHTHEKPVLGDAMATTGRCASTGGHYNPFKVNMQATYAAECSGTNPLRCELGDQSSKLGTYDMGSGALVANDPYLPLTGMFGVVGRSIVVHTDLKGAPRLACADILPVMLTHAVNVVVARPASLDREAGRVRLSQALRTAPYNLALEWLSLDNGRSCVTLRLYFLGMEAATLKQQFQTILSNSPTVLGDFKPVTCTSSSSVLSVILMVVTLVSTVAL